MKGQDSVVCNVLLVLTRGIWGLIGSSTGRGWNRKLALGHRTDGAEFESERFSMQFLNPKCGHKVNQRLGENVACKETQNAIKELCDAFTMLAQRRGPCLPQDVLLAFGAADRTRKQIEIEEIDEETTDPSQKLRLFQRKLALFHRLYSHVVCDVVVAIREQMQRELMGAKGFVAGLVKTDKSSKFYTKDPDTDEVKEQFISSASYSSLANAVVAKVMGRDLVAAHKGELKDGSLHDFLPPWARILSDYHANELNEFLGIAGKPLWGEHYNYVKNLHPIVDSNGNKVLDENGEQIVKVDGKSLFPKPGTCINVIHECGHGAASSLGSSKPGEQNFSTPACFSKTKPRANWRTLLDFTTRNFWKGQDEFLERIAESKQLYKAAEALGRLNA